MSLKRTVLFLSIVIIVLSCFCACGGKDDFEVYKPKLQKQSDNLDIMTSSRWVYDFEGCSYVLRMSEEGEFTNYCACGSPAGYSDLIEYYIYDDETKTIYLYNSDKKLEGKGKVMEISKDKLVIEKYDEVCTYVPDGEN